MKLNHALVIALATLAALSPVAAAQNYGYGGGGTEPDPPREWNIVDFVPGLVFTVLAIVASVVASKSAGAAKLMMSGTAFLAGTLAIVLLLTLPFAGSA